MKSSAPQGKLARLRTKAVGVALRFVINDVTRLAKYLPAVAKERQETKTYSNLAYLNDGLKEHLLDIVVPKDQGEHKLPVLVYIHGGGFRLGNKETHWPFAARFARHGFVVANINYRLAPYKFPAAIEDACHALIWVIKNIEQYGGDPKNIVLAGESAGGNLVTALTLIACHGKFQQPWAKAVFKLNPQIKLTMPACGFLQISDPKRYYRGKKSRPLLEDRIMECAYSYLTQEQMNVEQAPPLADPLLTLEQIKKLDRKLPPFYALVGGKDPIFDDTLRLEKAAQKHKSQATIKIYEKGVHAFHAFLWTKLAKRCWEDQLSFLAEFRQKKLLKNKADR